MILQNLVEGQIFRKFPYPIFIDYLFDFCLLQEKLFPIDLGRVIRKSIEN